MTIYDIHKILRKARGFRCIHYGKVNKRVRALEQVGYVKAFDSKSTKAGFEATIYELNAKAYLALMLDAINPDNLLRRIDDHAALEILAVIAGSIC